MEVKCPYCGHMNDFETEFTEFLDCGDYVLARAHIECECGEQLIIEANFEWDGKLEVR